jgi:hypothetical protein
MDISQLKTPDAELISPEIHVINKKIAFRRQLWNRYLTIIIDLFVTDLQANRLTDTYIDRTDAFVLSYDDKIPLGSQKAQLKIIKEYPKIYLIGGSAYLAYDNFINISKDSGIKITSYAPATHDYDVLIALTQLNEDNFNKILAYLTIRLQLFIKVLSIGAYLETLFEEFNTTDITDNPDIIKIETSMGGERRHESFLYTEVDDGESEEKSEKKKKSYIEINTQKSKLRQDLQYDYINIRCSVKIKEEIIKDGVTKIVEEIFDIFEFNLTNNSFIEIPIKTIIVLLSQDLVTYRVPDAHSLCKLGIYSLIKRGLNKNFVIKCRQDYKRVRYFIERMKKLYSDDTDLALKLYYLLPQYNYPQILSTLIQEPLLNHCTTEVFVRDNFLKKTKSELNSVEDSLLNNFIRSFLKDGIIINKSKINSDFKIKYLKYKQKYVELKKIL